MVLFLDTDRVQLSVNVRTLAKKAVLPTESFTTVFFFFFSPSA